METAEVYRKCEIEYTTLLSVHAGQQQLVFKKESIIRKKIYMYINGIVSMKYYEFTKHFIFIQTYI